MAFEDIECIRPAASGKPQVPPKGVAVSVRKLSAAPRAGGGVRRYIKLVIGAELARLISLTQPEHRLRLLFGTAEDAGKVRVTVDNTAGKFLSKRSKKGDYSLTINEATAAGLFSLEFDPFVDDRCEPIRPANGQPPHFVFKASPQMLEVDDE